MIDKLKKTLGRRKPLGSIPEPNATVSAPAPVADSRAVLRSHVNKVLTDPESLENHYRDMLQSRGTSEFATGQMGQLNETTKRELVRMWLMSRQEDGRKATAKSKHVQTSRKAMTMKKRSLSDASGGKEVGDEKKRQKTADSQPTATARLGCANEASRTSKATNSAKVNEDGKSPLDGQPLAGGRDSNGDSIHLDPQGASFHRRNKPKNPRDATEWANQVKNIHEAMNKRESSDSDDSDKTAHEETLVRLRLFLRAESITCLEEFIVAGGLLHLVKIVTAILQLTWRSQDETRLLLGILHCVRIIVKTAEGAVWFSRLGLHDTLFPALIRMQFSWGEERRAFFRFDHRAVITELCYYWVLNAADDDKRSSLESRANQMLKYMQDFEDQEKQHHDFVAAMHRLRRFKNWHKEVQDTTKPWRGTPWMYYHKENKIAPWQQHSQVGQPKEQGSSFFVSFGPTRRPELISSTVRSHTETLVAHYVAANLDLMNVCLVAQPSKEKRNALRQEFADCGFEQLFGSKLRLASQVNFPCIESALRDWVTAAQADGWPTKHVTAIPDDEVLRAVHEQEGEEENSLAPASCEQQDRPESSLARCVLNFDILEDTAFDL